MKLIDNINDRLGEDIKRAGQPGTRPKLAASCFSVFTCEALMSESKLGERVSPLLRSKIPQSLIYKVSGSLIAREIHGCF